MTSLLSTFPSQAQLKGISHCDGPYIYTADGSRLLDMTAGGTSFALLGWNNRAVNEAIISQLEKYSHLDYKSFEDPNRELLASLLTRSTASLDYCFLSGGSGAEACEMAIHMSYQQHCEEGNPQKINYISRKQSYHGATSMAMALGDRPNLSFYNPIHPQNVFHVSEPNFLKNRIQGQSEEDYCNNLIAEFLRTIEMLGASTISAFVAETCLGGLVGDVPPPKNYWKQIRSICSDYNIHLILDEVWCGTGVSGKYNCYEYDDILPDFLFIGKTLACGYIPMSAVLVSARFVDTICSNSRRVNTSSTFQGHCLGSAAAVVVQTFLSSAQNLDHIYQQGCMIRERLSSLLEYDEVIDVRGRGLRNSIEYSVDQPHLFGQYIADKMLNKHSVIVSGKWHRISLCNPVNMSNDLVEHVLDLLVDEISQGLEVWPSIDKNSIPIRHVY